MKKTMWIILISSLEFISCKSSQNSKEIIKSQEKKKSESISASAVTPKSVTDIYRITVSFYSAGGGIDDKTKSNYDKFVKEFEQQRGVKLSYEITQWGKEGETDYCFPLSELNSKDKDQFANESKKLLLASNLVTIQENTSCKHKK